MNSVIRKYSLSFSPRQTIRMASGAKLLGIVSEVGEAILFTLESLSGETCERVILSCPTDVEFFNIGEPYVGSFYTRKEHVISDFHVFDGGESPQLYEKEDPLC